jgi:ADP-ribose pyrophosphatase YjhB (NUDIX family)
MTTDRRFARSNAGKSTSSGNPDTSTVTTHEIPEGGMCLSAFVVLTRTGSPNQVLIGHLNPEAMWDHIGALDPERVEVHSRGWMIPSSHLLLKEPPQEAAKRILKEQLELKGVKLSEPAVVSEVYTPRRFPDIPSHWDLEFIFRGELSMEKTPRAFAWKELAFVDVSRTRKSEMARSHEDVLESAGFRFAEDSAPSS